MGDKSGIEWTDATWNPIVGCSIHSPGCKNCYAMSAARRLQQNPATPQYKSTIRVVNKHPVWTGRLNLAEKVLLKPWRWKSSRRIFVNSMGDLFHEDMPADWIDLTFAIMAATPQHEYQVLTKRADRMHEYLGGIADDETFGTERWANILFDTDMLYLIDDKVRGAMDDAILKAEFPLPNVRLGVSVENQKFADKRIPLLLRTPAASRFISAEPLLGPVDLRKVRVDEEMVLLDALTGFHEGWADTPLPLPPPRAALDWVIVGGESGKGARQMYAEWARTLRDQCLAVNCAFFFKQWGEWVPPGQVNELGIVNRSDRFLKWSKRVAGRYLDGRTWDEFPATHAPAR